MAVECFRFRPLARDPHYTTSLALPLSGGEGALCAPAVSQTLASRSVTPAAPRELPSAASPTAHSRSGASIGLLWYPDTNRPTPGFRPALSRGIETSSIAITASPIAVAAAR